MARRCGLSKGYFRPSDDATTFSYHIPSQAMMVVEVRVYGGVDDGDDAEWLMGVYPCAYKKNGGER
jgi:hypothetical protein